MKRTIRMFLLTIAAFLLVFVCGTSFHVLAIDGETGDETTVDVTVTKIWDDDDNVDKIRPETVFVQLYGNGDMLFDEVELNETSDWTYTWPDMDPDVEYDVKEMSLYPDFDYYETSVVEKISDYEFTITNTHKPWINVTVTKIWDDHDDHDGLRPELIGVRLFRNGERIRTDLELSDLNNWTVEWQNLNPDAEYTVEEIIVYPMEEYDPPVIEKVSDYEFTITNSHMPLTEAKVTKVWDVDETENPGVIPDSLTVKLLADGTEIKTVTLTAEKDWIETVTDLPMFNGEAYVEYTWEEVVPSGFQQTNVQRMGSVSVITNVYNPDPPIIKVDKVDDQGNPVKGAVIGIKDNSTGSIVEFWTTDGTTYEATDLWPGEFTLVENTVPEGYEKADDMKFTVKAGETVSLKMVDKKKKEPIPNTADHNNTASWTAIMLGSLLLAVMTFACRRKYSHN